MKNLSYIFLSIFLCASISSKAQWISFDKSDNNQAKSPTVKLISNDSKSCVIKVNISGVMVEELKTKSGTFQRVNFLSDIYTTKDGNPEVPYISKVLAIPNNASVSYKVIEVGDIATVENVYLPPARNSWVEGSEEPQYLVSEKSYNSNSAMPGSYVKFDDPAIMRDFRICRVSIFPAQYNAQKRELQVAKSLTIEVKYGNEKTINKKTSPQRKISPSFAAIYRNTIFNYQEILEEKYDGLEDGPEVLLLITPDAFYDNFADYIEWKKQSGYEVIVTKFSDISATSSNPVTIYNHISDLYENSENPPTYVAIAGDANVFPYKIATYPDYSFPDEDYFVKVDGDDFFPDMFIGRISFQTSNTLDVILNKFVKYEKTPYVSDPSWFKKGICCSNNEYDSQVSTKEYTANIMLEDGDFSLVNEYMSDGTPWMGPEFECTYDTYDVIDALNDGRSFLNYRGEGWDTGWWANCTPFTVDDLNQINNGEKFPFITSIGCGVSMFNTTGGNSFGEQWLKMGTISSPRGAINFIGPTSNTHTAENNHLDKGLYIGTFQEGLNTPGQILFRGKQQVYNQFGNVSDTEYEFRVFCDLGDPSTKIWKTTPLPVTASHPESMSLSSNSVLITLKYSSNNAPVANANVNILGEDFSINVKTNSSGEANFNFTPTVIETVKITATGEDIIPYIGSMIISESSGVSDNLNNDFYLTQNLPNPFTTSTEIIYNLTESSDVTLNIYNMQGQHVRSLCNEHQNSGTHKTIWDGTDESGMNTSPGVYIYSIQTNIGSRTLRMMKVE